MFCPKCGAENFEEAKYCRRCGLDLSTIARAMEKHLPNWMLEKIDDRLAKRKYETVYRHVLSLLLLICIYGFAIFCLNTGYGRDAFVLFLMAGFGTIGTAFDYLIYVRGRSQTKIVLTTSDYLDADEPESISIAPKKAKQKSLPSAETAKFDRVPASVTEATTDLLAVDRRDALRDTNQI